MVKVDAGEGFYQIHLHSEADPQLTVIRTEVVLTLFQTTNNRMNLELTQVPTIMTITLTVQYKALSAISNGKACDIRESEEFYFLWAIIKLSVWIHCIDCQAAKT